MPALRWFKSSYSSNNGDCVEVAFVPADPAWSKSSYSANNGTCVEVAFVPGRVAARDSKNPDGPVLLFPASAWRAVLDGLPGC